jgi:hypothetical protein
MADLVYRLPVHFLVSRKVFCSSPISCEENSLAPLPYYSTRPHQQLKKCSYRMVYSALAASQNEHHITVCIPNQSTWLNRWRYTWVLQDFFSWTVLLGTKPKIVHTILKTLINPFLYFLLRRSCETRLLYHTSERLILWCSRIAGFTVM